MGNVNKAAIDHESRASPTNDTGNPESSKHDLNQFKNALTLENHPVLERQKLDVEYPLIFPTEPDDSKLERNVISTLPQFLLLDSDSNIVQDLSDTLAKPSDPNFSNDSNTSFPIPESDLPKYFDTSLDLNSAGSRETPSYFSRNDSIDQISADQETATPEITSLTASGSRIEFNHVVPPPKHFPVRISSPCKTDTSTVFSTETNEPMLIDSTLPPPIAFDSVSITSALVEDATANPFSASENTSIRIPLVTTYADATNLAARFPELASEILVQPLSADPDKNALRNLYEASRTNGATPIVNPPPIAFAVPAHTADYPNWAIAPDAVRPPPRKHRRNKRNERANLDFEAERSGGNNENKHHAQRRGNSHGPQKDRKGNARSSDHEGPSRSRDCNAPVSTGYGPAERTTYQYQHTQPQSNSDRREQPPHLPVATVQSDSNSLTVYSPFNESERSADGWQPAHGSWVSGGGVHLVSHQTNTDPEKQTQNVFNGPPSRSLSNHYDRPPHIPATRVLPLTNWLDASAATVDDARRPDDPGVATREGNSSRGNSHEMDRLGVTPSPVSSQNNSLDAAKDATEQYIKMRKQQVADLKVAAYRYLGGRSDPHQDPKSSLSGGRDPKVHADYLERQKPENLSLPTEIASSVQGPAPETVLHGDKHENPSSGDEDTRSQNDSDGGKVLPEWRRRCGGRSLSPKYVPPPVALSRRVSPVPLSSAGGHAKLGLVDSDASKSDRPPSREDYPFRDIHLRTNNVDPVTPLTSEKTADVKCATFDTVLDVRPPTQSGVAALAASRASKIFNGGSANEINEVVGIDSTTENIPVEFNYSMQSDATGWLVSAPNKPTQNVFSPGHSLLKSKLNPRETTLDPVNGGSAPSQWISDTHDAASENRGGTTPPFELHHHLQSTTVNWFAGRESFTVDSSLGASQASGEAGMKQEQQRDRFSRGSGVRHDHPTDSAFGGRENSAAVLFSQFVDPRRRRQSQPPTDCEGFGTAPGGNMETVPFTSAPEWPPTGIELKEQHVDPYNELMGRKRKGEDLGGEYGKRDVDGSERQKSMPQRSTSYGMKQFVLPPHDEALALIGRSGGRRVSEGTKRIVSTSGWV